LRFYTVLLITTLILLPGFVAASNVDFYVTDVSPQVLEPGKMANITLGLQNLGIDYAVYVKAMLDPDGTSPLVATGAGKVYLTEKADEATTSEELFGIVSQGDSLTATYEVYVSEATAFGVYNIPLKVLWKNNVLDAEEETLSFGIKIVGQADLMISSVNTTPSRIRPDDEFTLKFNLVNIGKEDAEAVRATLVDVPQGFTGETSTFLGTISEGSTGSARFELKADESVEPNKYDLSMELVYLEKGTERKITRQFSVFIQTPGDITLPITKVSTDPSKVYPDSDFSLSLGLENAGDQDAKSVEVDLVVPEVFTGETNAFFGPLDMGSSAETSLDLKASKEATPGSYDARMRIRYLDDRGVESVLEKGFQIFVHERGDVKIEIAGITTSPAKIYPGDDFTLSVQLENVGTQDAKSVKGVIQPIEGFSGERTSFLGSLKEDDLSTAIFELGTNEKIGSGPYEIELSVEYTDELGLGYSEPKTFQMMVSAKEKSQTSKIGVGFVVLLLVVYGWRRRSASKAEGG